MEPDEQDALSPVGAFIARIWASGSYPLTTEGPFLLAMGCETEFLHLQQDIPLSIPRLEEAVPLACLAATPGPHQQVTHWVQLRQPRTPPDTPSLNI